jgi:hypothetical protein
MAELGPGPHRSVSVRRLIEGGEAVMMR